ncbi:hypothetical protein GOC83_09895 [Haloarcula rubripromontorii]|uniref:Uncharacterized protein n=1 Tax=Haloarcula rubripromontorii TaxID=1705562 RepID=A0A847U0J4_9EURY|nr:hypothetical protein [Haloarcula rubripromontorii]NLV06439.1 hypothetical protein [Haloarcula rubripromontorii]
MTEKFDCDEENLHGPPKILADESDGDDDESDDSDGERHMTACGVVLDDQGNVIERRETKW